MGLSSGYEVRLRNHGHQLSPVQLLRCPGDSFQPGSLITCELFLNGQILTSYPPPAGEVAYTWYPHRIVRETVVQGIRFRTQTFLPSRQRAAAELISVKNESQERRHISLGFDLRAGVTVKREGDRGSLLLGGGRQQAHAQRVAWLRRCSRPNIAGRSRSKASRPVPPASSRGACWCTNFSESGRNADVSLPQPHRGG